jgi:polar amino acid transport system substrate-binding protein
MSSRVVRIFGVLLASMTMLASQTASADKLKDVIARGYLIVGTTSTTPPFGYKDE